MYKALLLDLDDTLLANNMDGFIPAYFKGLTESVVDIMPGEKLIRELLKATHAMAANDGAGPTNEELFESLFYPGLGYERDELRPRFEQFYAHEFPKLRSLTASKPEARRLVDWAFANQLDVVIATNPLFPATAIEQRIAWAEVPVDEYPYALVTTFENMHATKAHPIYYREILDMIGRAPEECLMVGDNWGWDVAQPAAVGIASYWIADPTARPEDDYVTPLGVGSLADFEAWIRTTAH
ncbi:MAG: HAD family hydrolase [bacterium]|nr:HAD family hydrolase [bacterium]